MKYCLNFEEMFPEMDFYDKFKASKEAGFDYVEFWGWEGRDLDKIKALCDEYGITVTGIKGEKDGSLCGGATQDKEFFEWLAKSIAAAKKIGCKNLIFHSNTLGANGPENLSNEFTRERLIANMTRNLIKAAPILEDNEINICIEPLNAAGFPGLFLNDTQTGADIVRAVGSPNVQLLCDIFQMQVEHGNVTALIMNNLDIVHYIHMADSPDRGQPGTGELNYAYILNTLRSNGFEGIAAFEMTPQGPMDRVVEDLNSLIKQVK